MAACCEIKIAREYSAVFIFFSMTRGQLMTELDTILRGLERSDVLLNLSAEEVDCELGESFQLHYYLLESNIAVAAGDINRLGMFNGTAARYYDRIKQIEAGIAMARLNMGDGIPPAQSSEIQPEEPSIAPVASGDNTGIIISENMNEIGTENAGTIIGGNNEEAIGNDLIDLNTEEGAVGGQDECTGKTVAEASTMTDESLDEATVLPRAARIPMFPGPEYKLPPLLHSRLFRYMKEREMSSHVRATRLSRAGSVVFDRNDGWAVVDFYDNVVDSSYHAFDYKLDLPPDGAECPFVRSIHGAKLEETSSAPADAVESITNEIKTDNAQTLPAANEAIGGINVAVQAGDNDVWEPAEERNNRQIVVPQPNLPRAAPAANVQGRLHTVEHRYPLCQHCGEEGHNIIRCPRFLALTVDERLDRTLALNLCVNCFRRHFGICLRPICPRCNTPHNSLLCKVNPQ